VGAAFFLGCVIVVVFAAQNGIAQVAGGLMLALAASSVGLFFGFLFGVPRASQQLDESGEIGVRPKQAGKFGRAPEYRPNTNLEQISDWLTKILVGAELVEIKNIETLLDNISNYWAPQTPSSHGFVSAAVIFFPTCGFLTGWLWGRIVLTSELFEADTAAQRTSEYYEGLMHAYLYQPPPGGFSDVLLVFDDYADSPTERMWIYRACAHAQEYSWEKREPTADGKPTKQAVDARDQALKAVRTAITLSPDAKPTLRMLWSPKLQYSEEEVDLQVFYDDPHFIAALGEDKDQHPFAKPDAESTTTAPEVSRS
jgi:hypothetical protein